MNASARNAYVGGMVQTASPARLLVMLLERLQRDVEQAATLQDAERYVDAGRQLIHAQEIVLELRSSLDHDVWDGAAGLDTIYAWLHTELVRANVQRDASTTRDCLRVIEPLVDTWREAALAAVAAS
jgi:flagellar protein FliS